MSLFTPAHLGKWEPLYTRLLEGESLPLTEDAAWMLGRKTGVIAIVHEGEPIYIEATKDIGRTISEYLNGGTNCDFAPRSGSSNSAHHPERRLRDRAKGRLPSVSTDCYRSTASLPFQQPKPLQNDSPPRSRSSRTQDSTDLPLKQTQSSTRCRIDYPLPSPLFIRGNQKGFANLTQC